MSIEIFFLLTLNLYTFQLTAQSTNGLVAHWSFDEISGKKALDDVSNIVDSIHYIFNDLQPSRDPVRRNGILKNALVFDGFSNYIERPANAFSKLTQAMSISVWVAPRAFEHGDAGKLSAIVNQQNREQKTGFALGMFRHGSWSFQVGTGDRWIEIWDEGNLIPRRGWSKLVATYNPVSATITLYLNGNIISQKSLFKKLPIKPAAEPLLIGLHNHPEILDKRSSIKLNMFNGFMDDLKIYNYALSDSEITKSFNDDLATHQNKIPQIAYSEIKIDRAQFKDDPYRPQYHAIPPGAWMNEPHAPFYYKGKYHLTYQHNPTGPYWHQIHWGHWVSSDLVHWYDVPEAIFPSNDSIAPDGIWSGSATVDEHGIPVLIYTAGNWSKAHNQEIAKASPKDTTDTDLSEWIPDNKIMIPQKDGQGLTGEFRDPFAWKDKETNKWYLLVGSGIQDKGGTAWFYESGNFHDWNLKGTFYQSNYEKYPFLGSIWELPVFLPIGKYESGETRYIMIISPKGYRENVEVYYWLGRFDKVNYKFIPDDEEPQYWDYGIHKFIGPSGFIDPKTGRVLIFTITAGGHGTGWAGNASFPSHIFLNKDGNLGVKPIQELQTLRKKKLISISNKTISDANKILSKVQGDMLEILLEMEAPSDRYGIKIRKSADGREETNLVYDNLTKKLKADVSKSSLTREQENDPLSGTDKRIDVVGHFDLKGEPLKMHIYIDKSLIQSYINDLKTITTWVYPSLADAKELEIWSEDGKGKVKSLSVWEMKSIYY